MEDTHWEDSIDTIVEVDENSLNPCFNGRYSLRVQIISDYKALRVLILVLMEDTHWGNKIRDEERITVS